MQNAATHSSSTPNQLTGSPATRIEPCLTRDCVTRVEYTDVLTPGYAAWQTWDSPTWYRGDTGEIFEQIERCRNRFPGYAIRLSIENTRFRARFLFLIQPSPADR